MSSKQLATVEQPKAIVGLSITKDKAEKLLSSSARSIPSAGDYWSPQEGETKKVIIFGMAELLAQQGDKKDLKPHILMGEVKINNGIMSTVNITNCSARLVSGIRSLLYIPLASGEYVYMADGSIIESEQLPITAIVAGRDIVAISYMGKRKNSSNVYLSDRWSINKLVAGE